jgi:hypothetical protein
MRGTAAIYRRRREATEVEREESISRVWPDHAFFTAHLPLVIFLYARRHLPLTGVTSLCFLLL